MIDLACKKCNFLLIFPHNKTRISPQPYYVENLGIQYIASSLRAIGHSVKLINADMTHENSQEIMDKILQFNPHVIGISPCYTTMDTTLQLAVKAKKNGIFVCLGGHHATFFADDILSHENSIDFIVRGEGEITIQELANVLESSFGGRPDIEMLIKINGLSFKYDNKVYHNDNRSLIKDIDSIPFPARDLLKYSSDKKIHAMPLLSTSRGCPGNCSFCSTPGFYNRTWRARSASKIVDEIQEIIVSTGYSQFYLTDDQFAGIGIAGRKHIEDIIFEIRNRNIHKDYNLHFFIMLRSDFFKNKHEYIIKQFPSVGFVDIFIGFETGSSKELSLYKKGQTLKQYNDAIIMCKKYNLFLEGGFILFNPFTTFETLKKDAEFIKNLGVPLFGYYTKELMVLPGTQIFKKLNDDNLLINSSYKGITFRYKDKQVEELFSIIKYFFSNFEHHENIFFQAIDFEVKLRNFISKIENNHLKNDCINFLDNANSIHRKVNEINYYFFLSLIDHVCNYRNILKILISNFNKLHKSTTDDFIKNFIKLNSKLKIINI